MRSIPSFLSALFPKSGIFILIVFLTLLNPIQAIEYGGIGGRPAYPRKDNPRSDSIFIHDITPGQVIQEGITVLNNTNSEKTLIIYATDYTPATDGGFACKQFGDAKTAVGSWITLEKSQVSLKSQTNELVPFTITVPNNPDVGEHNGCIVVQEKKEESTEPGLNLAIRTGLRVLLTMPGVIQRLLELTDFQVLDNDATTYIIKPTINNKGNVSVESDVYVYVRDFQDGEFQKFGGKYSILKDNPMTFNFDFTKPFWGGLFKAQTIAVYNNGDQDITLTSDIITFFCLPHIYVLIGIAVLIITIFLFILLKRRKKKKQVKKKKDD